MDLFIHTTQRTLKQRYSLQPETSKCQDAKSAKSKVCRTCRRTCPRDTLHLDTLESKAKGHIRHDPSQHLAYRDGLRSSLLSANYFGTTYCTCFQEIIIEVTVVVGTGMACSMKTGNNIAWAKMPAGHI